MTDLSSCEGACAPVPAPDWIAVDWGTSALRAWAMGRDGRIHARAASGAGMGSLSRAEFEPALIALIGPWLETAAAPVPVIACGMVGARQGWQEAPYRSVPCAPLAGARDLADALADDKRVARCMVTQLYRNTAGRLELPGERPGIKAVEDEFAASGYRYRELLLAFVTSEAFRTVATPEDL